MKLLPITLSSLDDPRVMSSVLLQDVCQATLAIFNNRPILPWCGYLAQVNRKIVGTCAFKSVPQQGRVEIAYFTFPGEENKGFGTEMLRQLIAQAKVEDEAVIVFAQTLPTFNISTHILQKLGFVHTKALQHPEDGEVWEWELV